MGERTPTTDRFIGVELLRVIAACGIVWFHMKAPGAAFAYGGLPALVAISVAFAATARLVTDGAARAASGRLRRMLVPWVVWSLVFGAAKVLEAAGGSSLEKEFRPWMILTGTALHLWYLPFAAVVTFVVAWLAASGRFRATEAGTAAGAGIALVSIALCVVSSHTLERVIKVIPFAQWVFVLPTIAFGYMLAWGSESRRLAAVTGMGLSACAGLAISFWTGADGLVRSYGVAVAACAGAWLWRSPCPARVLWLSRLAFGVYLVHPLVASVTWRMQLTDELWVRASVVIVLSFAVTEVIRRTPLRFAV